MTALSWIALILYGTYFGSLVDIYLDKESSMADYYLTKRRRFHRALLYSSAALLTIDLLIA